MSRDRVMEIARGELGQTESPPGSNLVKYWDEVYPTWNGQPWCAVFLLWCFRKAGEAAAFFGGAFTASCSTLLAWYKSQGQVVPVSEVQKGDIVLLNFHGGQTPEHCGLVVDVTPNAPNKEPYAVTTIEGNTSPGLEGSQANGGCVALKRRYPAQIVAVCRPSYTPDPPKPDYEGHWAEESIRKAIAKGVLKGYEDGSFAPDKPITRAELCVILDRVGVLE